MEYSGRANDTPKSGIVSYFFKILFFLAVFLTLRSSHHCSPRTRHACNTLPMSKPGMKQGRQMATIFAEMLKDCPGEVGVYGQCASGGLPASMEHGNCDKEFASMKKCFQRVRAKTRLKPR